MISFYAIMVIRMVNFNAVCSCGLYVVLACFVTPPWFSTSLPVYYLVCRDLVCPFTNRINIDPRKSPKLSRATQEISRSPRLPIRKPSIGSPSLTRREFPLDDITQVAEHFGTFITVPFVLSCLCLKTVGNTFFERDNVRVSCNCHKNGMMTSMIHYWYSLLSVFGTSLHPNNGDLTFQKQNDS